MMRTTTITTTTTTVSVNLSAHFCQTQDEVYRGVTSFLSFFFGSALKSSAETQFDVAPGYSSHSVFQNRLPPVVLLLRNLSHHAQQWNILSTQRSKGSVPSCPSR